MRLETQVRVPGGVIPQCHVDGAAGRGGWPRGRRPQGISLLGLLALYEDKDPVSSVASVLMLPNAYDPPASAREDHVSLRVALLVATDLVVPELGILGGRPVVVGASMPVTTINEHGYVHPGEDDISATAQLRNGLHVHSVSEPSGVEQRSKPLLGAGIPTTVSAHGSPRSGLGGSGVDRKQLVMDQLLCPGQFPTEPEVCCSCSAVDLSEIYGGRATTIRPAKVGSDPSGPAKEFQLNRCVRLPPVTQVDDPAVAATRCAVLLSCHLGA